MDSTWPLTTSVGSPAAFANSENLMLDEPAFRTRMASLTAYPLFVCSIG